MPLTLETAAPTFGVDVPTLEPWTLSIPQPVPMTMMDSLPHRNVPHRKASSMQIREIQRSDSESLSPARSIVHRQLEVSSKRTLTATFQVPGTMSIPSDNIAHSVTIADLKLNATMSWVCVPKKDTKTRLSVCTHFPRLLNPTFKHLWIVFQAKIKNASEYTLFRGTGSVYVDGSFISRSQIPAVSPDESFDCPLG